MADVLDPEGVLASSICVKVTGNCFCPIWEKESEKQLAQSKQTPLLWSLFGCGY
jgi:hypothetical protein